MRARFLGFRNLRMFGSRLYIAISSLQTVGVIYAFIATKIEADFFSIHIRTRSTLLVRDPNCKGMRLRTFALSQTIANKK